VIKPCNIAKPRSDFHFADLRHQITSVSMVLPPNRLDAYSRWIRIRVSQALQVIVRALSTLTTGRGL